LSVSALLAGCGYVADTLPPLLNIPARVTDLAAVQRDGKLIVQFTFPHLTTEGTLIKGQARAELHIGPSIEPFSSDAWGKASEVVPEAPVLEGRQRYEIPAAGWVGKDVILAVKVIGSNGRSAGWSDLKALTVVPSPHPPTGLRAESVREGVRLTWKGDGTAFRVFRRLEPEAAWSLAANTDKPEFTDTGTEYAKRYQYEVQSLVRAGAGMAESELSDPEAITPEDRFPPSVPAGLTAVPSTGSIELVWDRSTETDLGGYRLFRANAGGPFERIAEIRDVPSYSDTKIQSGQTYRYEITAFDISGNESPRSAPVQVVAP
jgi:hypothetical protein